MAALMTPVKRQLNKHLQHKFVNLYVSDANSGVYVTRTMGHVLQAAAAAVVVMCTCLYLNSTAVALTSVWQRRKTQHHFVTGFVSNVCVFWCVEGCTVYKISLMFTYVT